MSSPPLPFPRALSPGALLCQSPGVPSYARSVPLWSLLLSILVLFFLLPLLSVLSLAHSRSPSSSTAPLPSLFHTDPIWGPSRGPPRPTLLPPSGRGVVFGGEAGSGREVGVDSLCSVFLKFSPQTWTCILSPSLKRSMGVLVLSHSWMLCVCRVTPGSLAASPDWDLDFLRNTPPTLTLPAFLLTVE